MPGHSDPKNTEMLGVGTDSSMPCASIPTRVEYNASNEVSSEYIFDHSPAASSYSYYTGYEPAGEWGDHSSFFGLDGQTLHFSVLQNENLPYVYYSPSYGYAYSSPDQYNAYMSGAVHGVDGSFIGTQQYIASPSYQPPASPSTYFPVLIQPGADFGSNVSSGAPWFSSSTSVASRPVNISAKDRRQTSGNTTVSSQNAASVSPVTDASRPSYQRQSTKKSSDLPAITVLRHDDSSSSQITVPVSASAGKNGNSTEVTQSKNQVSPGLISSFQSHLTVTLPSNSSLTNSGTSVRGWTCGEKYKSNSVNGNPNLLFEQNRGPRTNRSKVPMITAGAGASGPTKAALSNVAGSIMIYPDQYNRDVFSVDYPDAKFFVIKSYSEDDVHKSIKYNVWSSTPNGNRRLDTAYTDAQGRSLGKPINCPIFLFFSVNTSGQFCGVAEMVGPVDFHTDMDFWQQDKWSGSFPVKWHIIKDVPNSSFRHIILENNENKPVTNSRDTQEIPYNSGINMLKIFKYSLMTTTVLDDFQFYEGRQKMMLEEKCRRLGRSFDASLYVPAIVSRSSIDAVDDQSHEAGKGQFCNKDPPSGKVEQDSGAAGKPERVNEVRTDGMAASTPESDGKQPAQQAEQVKADRDQSESAIDQAVEKSSNDVLHQPSKADGEQPSSMNNPPKNGRKPGGLNELTKVNRKGQGNTNKQSEENLSIHKGSLVKNGLAQKLDGHVVSDARREWKARFVGDAMATHFIMKTRDILNTSMEGDNKVPGITQAGVVKVGSVHIKVNGEGESSSEIVNVGIDPLEPKEAKHGEPCISTNGNSTRK